MDACWRYGRGRLDFVVWKCRQVENKKAILFCYSCWNKQKGEFLLASILTNCIF